MLIIDVDEQSFAFHPKHGIEVAAVPTSQLMTHYAMHSCPPYPYPYPYPYPTPTPAPNQVAAYKSEDDPDKKDRALTALVPFLQYLAITRPPDLAAEIEEVRKQFPDVPLAEALAEGHGGRENTVRRRAACRRALYCQARALCAR